MSPEAGRGALLIFNTHNSVTAQYNMARYVISSAVPSEERAHHDMILTESLAESQVCTCHTDQT